MKSYKDLEIYNLAYELAIEVHEMTMKLLKYELYEQDSQIRRSSKRIKDTIAEGFGRRRYKDEFIRFLIFAHASCDETISQLEMISDIHFSDNPLTDLMKRYDKLGRKNQPLYPIRRTKLASKKPVTRNLQRATRNS